MPLFKMSLQTTRDLLAPPATRRYPFEKRAAYANTRGSIRIDEHKCILCVLCDKKCPTHAIQVDRKAKTWSIDRLKCIQCNYCVELCPKKCLTMDTAYTPPVSVKEVFTTAIPFTPPPKKPTPPTEPVKASP